jgi:hypothetical protein
MKHNHITLLVCLLMGSVSTHGEAMNNHPVKYSGDGVLLPWAPISDMLEREMNWYAKAPMLHGYPCFTGITFMRKDYLAVEHRKDFIPAMQNGMGIISYLKYDAFTGRKNPEILRFARSMGDFIITEALTPNQGLYPRFPRSTGRRDMFPQQADGGTQKDHPYETQPDKGAIAGYALVQLYLASGDSRYLDAAVHIAGVLSKNMVTGDASRSPWPFRVDFISGEGRGPISSNTVFALRLFDSLGELKHPEFAQSREKLWDWIVKYQIPSARTNGQLWVQFFEDHEEPTNRNAWAPLSLARYLVERKELLDPQWKEHARVLIDFVNRSFVSVHDGILVCGEQDRDTNPWGGVNSTYAAVLAMYAAATGSNEFKLMAHQALTWALYAIDDDGHPWDIVDGKERERIWQEDAHTDVVHNVVDALNAFPEWKE